MHAAQGAASATYQELRAYQCSLRGWSEFFDCQAASRDRVQNLSGTWVELSGMVERVDVITTLP